MDNKLVTKDNPEVQAFFEELENLLNLISRSFENYTPMLDNERFITDAELSRMIDFQNVLCKNTVQPANWHIISLEVKSYIKNLT